MFTSQLKLFVSFCKQFIFGKFLMQYNFVLQLLHLLNVSLEFKFPERIAKVVCKLAIKFCMTIFRNPS